MVDSRRRRSDVGSSRSSFPVKVKSPHFFKIITPSVVQNRNLKIPRKFMSKYGKNLANLVFLNVPSGAIWRVEMVSSNENAWLCKGWERFVEFYSIRLWHFLAFRYDGKSNFHVLIFDMTASEIEYPISASHGDQQANINNNGNSQEPETDFEVDDSVETLEDFRTCQTRREEIPKSKEFEEDVSIEISDGPPARDFFPSCKTVRTNVTCKMENTSNLQALLNFQSRRIRTGGLKLPNLKTDVKPHYLTRQIKKKCTRAAFQIPARTKSATSNVEFRALQRARDFKSVNPFFSVSVRPSHVYSRRPLYIPKNFAQKHLQGENAMFLRVSNGKTWSVKCYHECRDICRLGWVSFVRDNNLKVGDVCIFELIKGVEPCLNVYFKQ
ncbi:hypothetical protein U1Q18_011790 [Sarracenia purpurea var. burkii]